MEMHDPPKSEIRTWYNNAIERVATAIQCCDGNSGSTMGSDGMRDPTVHNSSMAQHPWVKLAVHDGLTQHRAMYIRVLSPTQDAMTIVFKRGRASTSRLPCVYANNAHFSQGTPWDCGLFPKTMNRFVII